jgi:putative salt-induced outer membrane protein
MNKRLLGFAWLLSAIAAPAAYAEPGWSGEGALSGGVTTGNTETTDVGVSLKAQYETGRYTNHGEFTFDYADQDDVESKNRAYGAYQLDSAFTDRFFGFFRTSYEEDKFSGFESRGFVGIGFGYDVVEDKRTKWTLKLAPGLRLDDVIPTPATATAPAIMGGKDNTFAAVFGSNFEHAFNDAVTVTNNTEIIYAEVSTQTLNQLALTAKLTRKFSARFSFEARNESDPPAGREPTDTATRIGLVYKL